MAARRIDVLSLKVGDYRGKLLNRQASGDWRGKLEYKFSRPQVLVDVGF